MASTLEGAFSSADEPSTFTRVTVSSNVRLCVASSIPSSLQTVLFPPILNSSSPADVIRGMNMSPPDFTVSFRSAMIML
ncbi:hypothetical protein D1872_277330 [compost metagenome]